MVQIVERYFHLKQRQKEMEQELSELRNDILSYCADQGVSELEIGGYKAKLISQVRKEYDERKLFEALPDLEVWRLLSKPDPAKIAGLIELNVISESSLEGAYAVRNVTLLQVIKV